MSKRLFILLVLCLGLLAPAHAGANHELPHVDPQPVVDSALKRLGNAMPAQFGGWLHLDSANQTWVLDCRSPSMPPEMPVNCPFSLAGSLDLDPHYGPLTDPACSIPRGYGGTGYSRVGGLFIGALQADATADPVTLGDARFARTPMPAAGAAQAGALVIEGQWSDVHGRADRFEAVFTALGGNTQVCGASGVSHTPFSGWIVFAGVLR